MSEVELRRPHPSECEAITAMCLRSKALWGYDDDFVAKCRDELTVTPAMIANRFARVMIDDGASVGYVEVSDEDGEFHLEKLFVGPDVMRRGLGAQLLSAAIGYVRSAQGSCLTIAADPGAVPFYCRNGAVRAGEVASGSIPGRTLPLLHLSVSGPADH